MDRLKGKVAIVTGAGGGQGAAEAKLFAEEGACVLVTDINFDGASKTASEINANHPGKAIAVKHNVASEEEWKSVVETAVREYGKVDILVNNAGILATDSYKNVDFDYWNKALSINSWSHFVGIKTVAPVMMENGGGSVVNIGSVADRINTDGFNPYAASKGAVEGITRTAASELAPLIRVNSIHPGEIDTPMLAGMSAEAKEKRSQEIPLKRYGTPKDIAWLALFLASDESSYITGSGIVIDGGLCVE